MAFLRSLRPDPALAFVLLSLSVLAASSLGCTVTTKPEPPSVEEPNKFPDATTPPPIEPNKTDTIAKPEPAKAAEKPDELAEVVYVFMRDDGHRLWFCTGTLVAKDQVVTAAHCLDPKKFISYEIVAPLAPDHPRVSASSPRSFGGDYDDVSQPDIGVLTLDQPITLPTYAVMTDVVLRVEGGEALTAAALVRTAEQPEAPLAMSAHLPLSSAVSLGYAYGFATPYFSHGGDSGAGLFLVENGKPTHKLVAVARQPEPDRSLDHFTRVGAPFLAWYATGANP